MTCGLCDAQTNERALFEDDRVRVISTSKMKGHRNRVMVVTREHIAHVSGWLEEHMMDRLEDVGRAVFGGEYKFVIMSPINGTVPEHAHFVATDLDPQTEDFQQIMATHWLRVVDVRGWNG